MLSSLINFPSSAGLANKLPFTGGSIIQIFASALLCVLFATTGVLAADTKPNVVLLVSDDQGWGDVGYHNDEVNTPNIDQLVKDGLEMNRWYSYAMCTPTRTSLLTGHISMRHGIFTGGGNLTHDEQLMNEAFKDTGYMTMTAGKWHLGMRSQRDLPINRGFDHTYGSLRAGPDYWTHGRGEQRDWARDGKTVFEGGYATDLFGNEISRLIRERDKSKPFFTYAAFTAPHTPLQAPQAYVDKYAHIEDMNRRVYCAMVEVLDVAIGNILKTIDNEGIRDNTLVLFFSDNGGQIRGGGGADNGDFRGGKTNVYEGGTRLPAIFRWPGKIPSGVKSEQPMIVYDLFPTLVEALGIPTKINTPFDGESLWDVLQTGKTRPRKTDMIIGNSNSYSVHSGDYKLVHSNINGNQPAGSETVELFKIYEDPNETANVAEEYPDVVSEMVTKNDYVAEWVRNAPSRGGRGGPRAGQGGPRAGGGAVAEGGGRPGGGPNATGDRPRGGPGGRAAAAGGGRRGPGGRPGGAAGGRPGGGPNATGDRPRGGPGGRAAAAGGGRRGPGGRPGGAAGGRPGGGGPSAPTRDSNGNIIHLHESVPAS